MITREEIKNMTHEQQLEELTDSMSEAVRLMARNLMMMKAVAAAEGAVPPEAYDKALEKQLKIQWDNFKDKSLEQLMLLSLIDLAEGGTDIAELLGA